MSTISISCASSARWTAGFLGSPVPGLPAAVRGAGSGFAARAMDGWPMRVGRGAPRHAPPDGRSALACAAGPRILAGNRSGLGVCGLGRGGFLGWAIAAGSAGLRNRSMRKLPGDTGRIFDLVVFIIAALAGIRWSKG